MRSKDGMAGSECTPPATSTRALNMHADPETSLKTNKSPKLLTTTLQSLWFHGPLHERLKLSLSQLYRIQCMLPQPRSIVPAIYGHNKQHRPEWNTTNQVR